MLYYFAYVKFSSPDGATGYRKLFVRTAKRLKSSNRVNRKLCK